jgi:uncharacterized protein GlcG (DUF336 family)
MIETKTQRMVAHDSAARIVAAALADAAENGWCIAVTVCDPADGLIAFARTDGCPEPIGGYANDKAWTAATHGKATGAFGDRMVSEPKLTAGLANRPRACAWDGGVPIEVNGEVVGGIGVSDAAGPQNVACAEAAIAAVTG